MGEYMKTFVYLLEPLAERNGPSPIVPKHLAHLDELRKKGLLVTSGKFEDNTGGMVAFSAESLEEAKNIANSDPFVKEKVERLIWVKEWNVSIEQAGLSLIKEA